MKCVIYLQNAFETHGHDMHRIKKEDKKVKHLLRSMRIEPTCILVFKIKIKGVSNGSEERCDRSSRDIIQGTYSYSINLKAKREKQNQMSK